MVSQESHWVGEGECLPLSADPYERLTILVRLPDGVALTDAEKREIQLRTMAAFNDELYYVLRRREREQSAPEPPADEPLVRRDPGWERHGFAPKE